jgi:hypothetical protein
VEKIFESINKNETALLFRLIKINSLLINPNRERKDHEFFDINYQFLEAIQKA